MQDNISKLYGVLKDTYDLGSEEDFRKYLSDSKKREALRKELESEYEVGDSVAFTRYLGFDKPADVKPYNGDFTMRESELEGKPAGKAAGTSAKQAKPQRQSQPQQQPVNIPSIYDVMENRPQYQPKPILEKEVVTDANGNRVRRPKLQQTFTGGRMSEMPVVRDVFGNEYDPTEEETQKMMREQSGLVGVSVDEELQAAYAERERIDKLLQDRREKIVEENDKLPWYLKLGQYANEDKLGTGGVERVIDNDPEYNKLMAAARKNNEIITTLEDRKTGQTNSFWHSLGNDILNGYNFSFGRGKLMDVVSLVDAQKHIDNINKKRANGEQLTHNEEVAEAVLKNAAWDNEVQAKYGDQYGAWARAGKMGATSADFMVDFALTGGMPTATAKGIANAVTKGGTKLLGNFAEKGFGKYMLRITGVTLGTMVAGAEITNTIQAPKTIADIGGRIIGETATDVNGNFVFEGGESVLNSFFGAERDGIGENASEILGEFMPGVGGVITGGLKKIGLSKVANGLTSLAGTNWYKNYSKALELAGFHGVPGEILEEYANFGYDAMMGGEQWKSIADKRTHIDIVLGCTTMGALLNAPHIAGTGYTSAQYYRYKHKVDMANSNAMSKFGEDEWQSIREQLDGTDNSNITDALVGILDNETLSDEHRAAIVNYARNLQAMRGYSLGWISTGRDEAEDSDAAQADNSYTIGYNTTEGTDMNDAKNNLELQQQRLLEFMTEDNLKSFDEDPIGMLSVIMGMNSYTDTEKQTALDYVNAKATYDGMLQRVTDDIDSRIAESDRLIGERRSKTDGMIHPATMKAEERKVYVVDGNVSMMQDGTMIDVENSDESVIVRDAETGEISFVSPHDILSVDDAIDADEEMQTARQAIQQEYAQQAADKIDGVLPFNVGDTYTILDEEGQQHEVTVVDNVQNGENGLREGDVLVSIDGEQVPQVMPMTAIQDGADNANLARLAEYEAQKAAEEAEQTDGGTLDNAGGEASPEQTGANDPSASTSDAMPMIGEGEEVEPDYLATTPERGHQYLYDETGFDREVANKFADNYKKQADDELAKLQKKQPQPGTSIAKYKREMSEWQAKVDEAQARADYWKSVKDIESKRAFAEQTQDAGGRQNELEAQKNKQARIEAAKQMYGDYFNSDMSTPQDIYEMIAMNLPKGISWEGRDGVRGLQQELGALKRGFGKNGDTTAFNTYLAKKGEGISIDEAIHAIWESADNELPNGEQLYDSEQIRGAVIDMFMQADKPGFFENYVLNSRIAAAETMRAAEDAARENAEAMERENAEIMRLTGLTPEEYEAWIEGVEAQLAAQEGYENSEQFFNTIDNDRQTEGNAGTSGEESAGEVQGQTGVEAGTSADDTSGAGEDAGDIKVGQTIRVVEPFGEPTTLTVKRIEGDEITVDVEDEGTASFTREQLEEYRRRATTTTTGNTSTPEEIQAEEAQVNTEPTDAQKEAGNYKKGHIKVDGFDVTIENPKGSVRRGVDASGKAWEQVMNNTYGYIRGTVGVDGDHIDVFLSDNPESGNVFVIDQRKADGSFDEHKVMYGFPDMESAKKAYLSNYEDGWQGLGAITEVSKEEFKKWIESSHRKTKPFSEYKSVKPEGDVQLGEGISTAQENAETEAQQANEKTPAGFEAGETFTYKVPATGDEFSITINSISDGVVTYHIEQVSEDANRLYETRTADVDRFDDMYGESKFESYEDWVKFLKDRETQPTEEASAPSALDRAVSDFREAYDKWVADTKNNDSYKAYQEAKENLYEQLKRLSDEELKALEDKMGEDYAAISYEVEREQRRREFVGGVEEAFNNGLQEQGEITSKAKEPKVDMDGFTSKDEVRAVLNGVYHDADGYAVATDGRILIADKTQYDAANNGKIILTHKLGERKKGDVEPGKYPNWKGVVNGFVAKNKATVTWDGIRNFLAGAEDALKARWNAEKAAGQTKESFAKWSGDAVVAIKMPNGEICVYNYGMLRTFTDAAARLGAQDITYAQDKPIITNTENGTAMLMPMMPNAITEPVTEGKRMFYEWKEDGRSKKEEVRGKTEAPANTSANTSSSEAKPSAEAKPKKKVTTTNPNKIDDFGEKIGGARKDVARDRIRSAAGMTRKDLKTLKKGADDILSIANILRLYNDGQMDEETARGFIALNNAVKAAKDYRFYDIALEKYRDAAVAWEDGKQFAFEITDEDVAKYIEATGIKDADKARQDIEYVLREPYEAFFETYKALNYPAEDRKIGRYVIVVHSKSRHALSRDRRFWVKNGYRASRGYPFTTMESAVEKMKTLCPVIEAKEKKQRGEKAEHGLHVVEGKPFGFFIKSRNIPGTIYLSKRFWNEKEAKQYLEDNLEALKEREQKMVDALMGSNIGMAEREGVDYRNGRDVTPDDFLNEFGFRGVEFGNWVPQAERQMYLNKTYDAIKDFCAIIGISPKAFSLGGRLGLAFGARGKSRAMAHYEPSKEVINLTRMSGVGSLAHEWFHALDNYLAKNKTGNVSDMATETHDVVRAELGEVFKEMYNAMKAMDYHKRSHRAGEYWGRTVEEFARLFENYIYNKLRAKEAKSPVLVREDVLYDNIDGEERNSWPYPSVAENKEMEPLFDKLFDTIQEKTDENGKVVLFQKAGEDVMPVTEQEAVVVETMVDWLKDTLGEKDVIAGEEGQKVLDEFMELAMLMGGSKKKSTSADPVPSETSPFKAGFTAEVDAAKVAKNLETLIEKAKKYTKKQKDGFIEDLAKVLGTRRYGSKSEYATFETKNGLVTIRLADHNAKTSNFDHEGRKNGVSIVISRKKNNGVENDGEAHLVEFFYPDKALKKAEGTPYADIVRSIQQMIYSGEYKDATGLAVREEVNAPISYQMAAPTFYSNAERAVEGIKQEKATPEQWLAMITKAGGLKAGEDKWLGLSEWLRGQQTTDNGQQKAKTLTKQEVLDFIRSNQIEVEDWTYAENVNGFEELKREYDGWLHEGGYDFAHEQLIERFGDDADIAFGDIGGELVIDNGEAAAALLGSENPINNIRLGYTTNGLNNKREIALVVPSIESWRENDEIHFGDAGEGRAVAWIRFGETKDAQGKRVLVIDEIQSKRHQEGREHGYESEYNDSPSGVYRAAVKAMEAYRDKLKEKYGEFYLDDDLNDEERKEYKRLYRDMYFKSQYKDDKTYDIPDAPFDKNWHELAMKRMLRYAAENGYDKIAWTKGEQQAERYNLAHVIDRIESTPKDKGHDVYVQYTNGKRVGMSINADGKIDAEDELYNGKDASDVFGKEIAQKITDSSEDVTLEDADLKIGGEGMRGFYDYMLPKFMDKYGKKWGVKTEEVHLDGLNGSNGLDMWSVDVTPEMKASVMEGQPMFFRTKDGQAYGFTLNGKIYIDPRIATSETPIHEYSHLWAQALRAANPQAWEQLKQEMLGQQDVLDYVKKLYPELEGDALVEEVFTHYSGKRGAERLRQEMQAEMAKAQGILDKARVVNMFHKLGELLKKFWQMSRDLFAGKVAGIENISGADFADMMMADLMNKVDPRKAAEAAIEARDKEYAEAVAAGDMEKVDAMLREEAARKGYTPDSDYQGTSAFNGAAPARNAYFPTREERIEAYNNGDFDGDASLGDFMEAGIDLGNLDWLIHNPIGYYTATDNGKESIDNLRGVVDGKKQTITMYRSVPADVKEGEFRNGDWVTPSRSYAEDNAYIHGWEDFRIIEQEVPVDAIWWDNNDINEWGYDNGNGEVYKNTENNRKLLEPTYDEEGNLIPLSQRFNENISDIRYQFVGEQGATEADRAEGVVTRIENLGVAKQMEQDGKTALSVKMATGWERGKDGKWRYETQDDLKAVDAGIDYILNNERKAINSLERTADMLLARLNRLDAQIPKRLTDKYSEEEKAKYMEMRKQRDKLYDNWTDLNRLYRERRDDFNTDGITVRLENILGEDYELFKYYPEMRNMSVLMTPRLDAAGEYDSGKIRLRMRDGMASTLLHEIQHAIQEREGFAKGGNIRSVIDDMEVRQAFIEDIRRDLIDVEEQLGIVQDAKNSEEAVQRYAEERGISLEDARSYFDAEEARLMLKRNRYNHLFSMLNDDNTDKSIAFDYYKRIAGEVESRNVQERANMTPEERRRTLAEETEDTMRGEQIVTYGEGGGSASIVEDEEEIARLEAEPKEIGYRNVVLNDDGTLGSPMASKLGKKGTGRKATSGFELDAWERSDEHPELATEDGKIDLIKPDGKTVDSVDYNPYIHIRPTLVNKQFKQAWERPNLVYVRTQYPTSELTSGYQAEKAKKSVGRHDWNGGELILSRWDKPIEIVPWEEVADDWVKEFDGKGIHFDIIPPMLLPILAERGMEILPPHKGMGKACNEAYRAWKEDGVLFRDGEGEVVGQTEEERRAESRRAGYSKRQYEAWREREYRRTVERVNGIIDKLNLRGRVMMYDSFDDIPKRVRPSGKALGTAARAKGWFDEKTGQIVVILGNHGSVGDFIKTILHEGVAHYGLRRLFGSRFNQFLDNVFENADESIRREIVELSKKHGWNTRVATEEYLARLAEDTDFENAERSGWWQKVKSFFLDMLHSLGLSSYSGAISDNELRYILWRSYKELSEPGSYRNLFRQAEDIDKQMRLGVGRFEKERIRIAGLGLIDDSRRAAAEAVAEGNGEVLFRDGDEEVDAGAMTPMEKLVSYAMLLADRHKDVLKYRIDAAKRLGIEFSKLRKAMSLQRSYDRETVNTIVRLAKMMMDNGRVDELGRGEVKKLIGLINGAAGKEDITTSAEKVVDMMIAHQLRECRKLLGNMLKVRGTKLSGSGVEIQGQLDIEGKRMLDAFKDAMKLSEESLNDRINDCTERMGSDDVVTSSNASVEYQGLMLAKQYLDDIKKSEEEETNLRGELKQEKESVNKENYGSYGSRKGFMQYVHDTEASIRENQTERIEKYFELMSKLGEGLASSVERAKAWREKEVQRVNEIRHNANSDLKGVPVQSQGKMPKGGLFALNSNNDIIRLLFQPFATFEKMLRFFGRKAQNGEGYLYNRFMRGWIDASDNEWRNKRAAHEVLDAKAHELFPDVKRWSEIFELERHMQTVPVEYWDNGERVSDEITQGEALYMYMVNKMQDGKMKLRKMGITEEDVDALKKYIDPRFIELGDWLQDTFLKEKRKDYNDVHERMFGASMAAIEDYFPLVVNKRNLAQETDITERDKGDTKPSTITGSVIKRKRNNNALSVHTDAFDVVLAHLDQMEHWAAFAEFNRDINTLLNYTAFKNKVLNMKSAEFGSGMELWKAFEDCCAIAADVYHPSTKRSSADNLAVNVAKGVTTAKIAFRIYTAAKQLLSMPAFWNGDASIKNLAKYTTIGSVSAWRWAMKNLPGFSKRWQSRQVGDVRLLNTDSDYSFWSNKWVRGINRAGMFANAAVDAITVAIGAKAVYETKKARYIKDGYSEAQAEKRALQDASIVYNSSQQSSENAFLSPLQLDRTWLSTMLTVFRSASMGYGRKLNTGLRNLKNRTKSGFKAESIEFMAKQMVRDGLSEAQAMNAAERIYNRGTWKSLGDVMMFGLVLPFFWNLGPYIIYLMSGGDDDKKKDMLEDAFMHTALGPIEGLSGGNVYSEMGNAIMKGDNLRYKNYGGMPLSSDFQSIINELGSDKAAAAQDIFNLLVQGSIGVNPETFTDMYAAIMDYSNGDIDTAKEIAMLVMRMAQVPQSTIDELYIDELGMTGKEAKSLSAEELAKRYAEYKFTKNAPMTGWIYSDEEEEKAIKKYEKRFNDIMSKRIETMSDESLQGSFGSEDERLKKALGKEVAKRMDAKDTYGSPTTEYGKLYLRYRDYFDIAEDVLLQTAENEAKNAKNKKRQEDIKTWRDDITEIKQGLSGVVEDDKEIMEELRELRREAIKELGIK